MNFLPDPHPAPILVVDDDNDIRESLKELLEMEGYLVITAANGAAALYALQSIRPSLILLDMAMPVMNGQEFLKHAEPVLTANEIPVLVLSATADASETGGAAEVLRKPPDIDYLLRAVRQHIEARSETLGLRREVEGTGLARIGSG